MKIKLNNVRLSFPSLFKKAVFSGAETKYEATFLLDKTAHAATIKELEAAIKEAIKTDLKGVKLPGDKICMKNGDDVEYAGYAGHVSVKASNNKRPMVIDRDRSPLTEEDGKFYAGCYVNAIIELWAQDNQWGKRINANLLAVQFFKDGEPFADGERASVEDFDIVDDAEVGSDFL